MAEKTRVSQEWIDRAWKQNPPKMLDGGNVLFGPVRLAFANLLERPKPGSDGKERAYGATLLIPPGVDISLLKKAATDLFREKAPIALTNKAVASKYHNPFKDQGSVVDKKTGGLYDGFVEGRLCISANTQSKPPVVGPNNAPIIDKARVYSGCWAYVAVAPRWFKVEGNEGPTFYLQSVMVVADDENLGGVGAANPSRDFAGLKVDPLLDSSELFESSAEQASAGGEVDIFG